nr:RNA methyltransferase [Prochlorococcus sp. MIT 1300]
MRSIATREGRKEHSMLLLEGTHLLEEALKVGSLPKELVATRLWMDANQSILREINSETQIYEVTPSVLAASVTTVSPDGVASLIPISALPLPRPHSNFVLALDRLQDPGNLGTLLRTALAAEIQAVWLAGGADPMSQKAIRASSGALLRMPICRFGDDDASKGVLKLEHQLRLCAKAGQQIVGSFVPGFSDIFPVLPYWELDWNKPTILLLGNEGSGIHPLLKSCCTHGVTLPHSSNVESLNVAAAAVPMLLERRRAKMTKTMQKLE